MIVQGIGAAVRRLYAEIIHLVIAGHVVAETPRAAAVLRRGLEGSMAAAVERHLAPRLQQATVGREVDDSGGAQAVFGRQRAGDEAQRGDQPRAQGLAEDADALGQDDAVQAVLQVVVVGTHVQLTEESCTTSGACSSSWFICTFSPPGAAAIAS